MVLQPAPCIKNLYMLVGHQFLAQLVKLAPALILDVMKDKTIELHLRIEAAQALLPYFEIPRRG